jgi:hypothetical protein
MRKKSAATHYMLQRLVFMIAVYVGLSACTHSDRTAEKKNKSLNTTSPPAVPSAEKKKQSTDKNLVPYFNRPPVGTPIETH